jgi:uncharacterized damage-inducible protein DinB
MVCMTVTDAKSNLREYLQDAREALLWKLDGLSEFDSRRPMVRTGTNLLGLVKHQTAGELGYFGATFGRPGPEPVSWADDSTDWDLLAQANESREFITDRYRRAWAHADKTISELPLDAIGHVPWWPAATNDVSLHQIMVHMTTETARHAGHADIIRELIDGAAGLSAQYSNLAAGDQSHWDSYRTRVEQIARVAAGPQLPLPGQ